MIVSLLSYDGASFNSKQTIHRASIYARLFYEYNIFLLTACYMATPNKLTPSGITTNFTSDQMYRPKIFGYGLISGVEASIPDRMTSSIESKRKVEIITKIENLFPFLQDIMGQNDARSNTIINRLIGLRENLD